MASANTVSGKDGTVTFNSLTVPCTQWDMTIEHDVKNTTDSDDAATGWESNIPGGFSRFSGTFEGFLQDGTVIPAIGTDAAATFLAETGITFAGNIIITSIQVTNQVHGGDAVKIVCNYTGNGAMTETNV